MDYRQILTSEIREEKIAKAALAYAMFMDEILPGWREDPNSRDTPKRVSKMFINELYSGLYSKELEITTFENTDQYSGIVFQGNIEVKSLCSHHNLPFFGKAFVAYIPSSIGRIIGLSKLNRIVDFFSRRPQVQENLTSQIHDYILEIIGDNKGVAVLIEAKHTCVSHRGIGQDSLMKTSKLSGVFINDIDARTEFYKLIG
jgi:GTP cyclohydrolase I